MKTQIIAEIGINHNGDLNIAKKLIDISEFAGCDVVKFQKRNPDVCVPEHQKGVMRDTPWGKMTYLEYKHKIEFGQDEYDEIDDYCRGKIDWTASPWDMDSVEFLEQYDLPFVKIPSALLTDYELIRECSQRFSNLVLSTGMSTIEEIDGAVKSMGGEIGNYRSQLQRCEFALLHCNSTYPAPVDELNLSCISTLRKRYGCEVGYSGHEYGLTTTISSLCFGATIIERHITLDKSMWGTDHMASVEPHGLIKLVRGIRELESAIGDGKKVVTDGEKPVRDKLRKI
jgi:N-acetylneuraminate synthase